MYDIIPKFRSFLQNPTKMGPDAEGDCAWQTCRFADLTEVINHHHSHAIISAPFSFHLDSCTSG